VSHAFNARAGVIVVEAEVSGPSGKADAVLVLDTGATSTSLNADVLRSIGYDPDAATEFVPMATGTALTTVPRLTINRLSALGRHTLGPRVLAHSLPPRQAWMGCSAWISSAASS
jgi:predicted aspartyl protease